MTESELSDVALALGRVPSGLFVLTARDGHRETGMLVSWVQQCSFEPPQLSVCVRQGRDVLAWLGEGAAITVNVLAAGQKKFISHFGKGFALDEDAFVGLSLDRIPGEAPILTDALAHLRCRVVCRIDAADHLLLIARVVGGRLQHAGEPHCHSRKSGLKY
jgi:flavin reductase (DIM6/NTAB) family NADH-FMN oxidoreductase RutF